MSRILTFAIALASLASACNSPTATRSPGQSGSPAARAPGRLTHVDAPTFRKLLEEKGGILVDVRTPGEVARGHLADATFIDSNDPRFAQKLDLMQKSKPVLVYCASGRRSAAAAELMIEKGFAEVYNLSGGISAWNSAGYAIDRSAAPTATAGVGAMLPTALDAILQGEKRVLVAYQTQWCGPCRKMAPVVDQLADAWKGKARVLKVEIDESEALAQREKIQGVPVFVLYVDGKERWRRSGEMPREVLEAELARP